MPRVCAASWPAPLMCTGVIAMTPTITRLPTAIALTPRRAAGCDSTNRSAARMPARGAFDSGELGWPSAVRATTAGSGRRNSSEEQYRQDEQHRGEEVRAGQGGHAVPAHGLRRRPAPGSGPTTAPSVVAHTIKERWRPRSAAGARSTAA